ncbi:MULTISPECIES: hypothetical protein [unclassified Campylobacter]|nr:MULTISPECIES: hypothetical protein [unclassified Campylobacter]
MQKSVIGAELEEQVKAVYEKYKIPLSRNLDEMGVFDLITANTYKILS